MAIKHEVIEVHRIPIISICALIASFALSRESGAQQPPPFMSSNQQVFMTEVVSDGNQGNGEYACQSNTTDCVQTSVHRIPPGFDNFAVFLSSFNVGAEAGYIPVQTLSARIFNDTYNPATGDVTWSSEVIFQESTSTTATITFNVHATILAWNGSGITVSPISEICTGADSASVCLETFIGAQTAWVPPGQQFITAAPKRLSFRTTTGAAIEMTGLGYGFDGPLTPNGTNYELDYDCRFNGETSPGNIVSTECELGGLIISAEPNMLVSSYNGLPLNDPMAPHDVFQYYPKDFNFCFDEDESDKSAPGWTCDRFSTRGTAPLGLFYYLLEEDPGVQGLFGAMNRVDADFATKPSQGDRQRVGSITFGCYRPRTQIQKTSVHPAQPEQADLLYCGLGGNQPFCLPYTEYSSYDAQTGVAGSSSIPTTQLPFVGHGSYQGTWNRLTMFFHASFATINPPGSLNSEPAVQMNCQQVGLP